MVDVVFKSARTLVRANTADPVGTNVLLRIQHGIHPTRIPLSLAVVMDTSGSMNEDASGERKIDKMRKALKRLIDHATLDGEDELILVTFNSAARVLYQGSLSRKADIRRSLDGMEASGGTQMATGLDEALAALGKSRREQQQILLFTDGEIHDQQVVKGRVTDVLKSRRLSVTAYGVGAEYQWEVLERLADETQGGFHHLTDLDLFGQHLEEGLIASKNQALRKVTADFRLTEGAVIQQMRRVIPSIGELDGEGDRYVLGHLRGDRPAVFIARMRLPPRPPGIYRIVTLNLEYDFEGNREQVEKMLQIEYTDDQNRLSQGALDMEVADYVRQAQVQGLVKEASRTTNMKEAENLLRQARGITQNLGNAKLEETLTQALHDIQSSGRVSPEIVRRSVSDARNTTRLSSFTPPPCRGRK